MISVEVSDTELFEIEQRFAVFFNGQGNNYIGALNYFHKLKQEQQRHLREHTVHGPNLDQKNLQKVPDSTLKSEVCSELFFHSRFLCSSKRLHSSPFLKMESSGFDDKAIDEVMFGTYQSPDKII